MARATVLTRIADLRPLKVRTIPPLVPFSVCRSRVASPSLRHGAALARRVRPGPGSVWTRAARPSARRLSFFTWVLLLVGFWGSWIPAESAQAAGKRRTVVDLRRDATAWTQQGSSIGVLKLPLTVHIATDGSGDPVVDHARVRRWVARANRELAGAGIEVEVQAVLLLPEGWSSITGWRQRRMLAAYAPRNGTIHVFVADELDTERRRIFRRRVRGLHWRYRGLDRDLRAREYVMVTKGAPVTTFVHELGHLFGLPHSTSVDNIMCSCRRGSEMDFTPDQSVAMRSGVRRFEVRQSSSSWARASDRMRR